MMIVYLFTKKKLGVQFFGLIFALFWLVSCATDKNPLEEEENSKLPTNELEITDSQYSREECEWIGDRPNVYAQCFAFYDKEPNYTERTGLFNSNFIVVAYSDATITDFSFQYQQPVDFDSVDNWIPISQMKSPITQDPISPATKIFGIFNATFDSYEGVNELSIYLRDANNKYIVVKKKLEFTVPVDYSAYALDPLLKYQWHLNSKTTLDLNAKRAHEKYLGRGVKVSVIDTGLEMNHYDLKTSTLHSWDFLGNDNDPTPVQSCPDGSLNDQDHGTLVAGVIGGRNGNQGLVGVAPAVSLSGTNLIANCFSAVYASWEYISMGFWEVFSNQTARDVAYAVNQSQIYNMSYAYVSSQGQIFDAAYYDEFFTLFQNHVEYGRDGKGNVYVKAAGNEFGGNSAYCLGRELLVSCFNGNMDSWNGFVHIISVASVNAYGTASNFSNGGSSTFISAFGGDVYSKYLQTEYTPSPGILTTDLMGCSRGSNQNADWSLEEDPNCDYLQNFMGTSAAAPEVSGVAALLLEANPELTWREVKHIIAKTALQNHEDYTGVYVRLTADNQVVPANRTDAGAVKIDSGWHEDGREFSHSNAYGFGIIDAANAVDLAEQVKGKSDFFQLGSSLKKYSFPTTAQTNLNYLFSDQAESYKATFTVEDSAIEHIEAVRLDISTENVDVSRLMIKIIAPDGTENIVYTPFNEMQGQFTKIPLVSYHFYNQSAQGQWQVFAYDYEQGSTGRVYDMQLIFYGH